VESDRFLVQLDGRVIWKSLKKWVVSETIHQKHARGRSRKQKGDRPPYLVDNRVVDHVRAIYGPKCSAATVAWVKESFQLRRSRSRPTARRRHERWRRRASSKSHDLFN
jgi:hypothetical protein